MKRMTSLMASICIITALAAVGCGTYGDKNSTMKNGPVASADKTQAPNTTSQSAHIVSSSYNPSTKTVTLKVSLYGEPGRRLAHATTPTQSHFGEDIIDLARREGIINYATSRYPNKTVQTVKVARIGPSGTVAPEMVISVPASLQTSVSLQTSGTTGDSVGASAFVADRGIQIPPPGCHIDHSIRAVAPASDTRAQKQSAVLSVARGKLGTPYIWGHNEDRGQRGFDCSNFTAYVYHHALGYRMTDSSRGQNRRVGVPVSFSSKQPGDLLIFEHGKHVGIYAGNNRMIQEGGGLGKVGYLSLGSHSYWGKHLTSVRRMF